MSGAESPHGFTYLGTEEVYRGHIIGVEKVRFAAPDGSEILRDVVRHPGAVAVVPLLGTGEVVLVRQFRAPFGRPMLEIPAGKLDIQGEDPATAAQRELAEEVGFRAGSLKPLVLFHNSVGFSDERSQVFLATELTDVPTDRQGPEELSMSEVRIRLEDAPQAIASGEVTDAKTVIGLLAALERLRGSA